MVMHDKRRQETFLFSLGKVYRKGKCYMIMSFQGIDHERENDVVNIASEIRLALRKMPKTYGEILLNDYFELQDYNWWKEKYSYDSYMQLKKQAITQFFDLLPNYCICELQKGRSEFLDGKITEVKSL